MASPTFNSLTIFDSIYDGDGTHGPQGIVRVGAYAPIKQTIHFNGAIGNTYLTHGYGDRPWKFTGSIYHYDGLSALTDLIDAIQTIIDGFNSDPTTYYDLVDNVGNSYTAAAQIHSMSEPTYQSVSPNGMLAFVTIEGIVQGNLQDGP